MYYYIMIYNLFSQCSDKTYRALFPYDVENMFLVLLINLVHIFGVLLIQLGIFLPGKYIKYYILYLVLLLISYELLNNRCFMTILSNYYGNRNYNSLCIKMNEAKTLLYIYLIVGIIIYLYPKYSLYMLLKRNVFCVKK